MSVLDILRYPDERLKQMAEPVIQFDEKLKVLNDYVRFVFNGTPAGCNGSKEAYNKWTSIPSTNYKFTGSPSENYTTIISSDKQFQDKNGLVNEDKALCPMCSSQVVEVDKDDEIYSCCGNKNKHCNWSGKLCQLDFQTGE